MRQIPASRPTQFILGFLEQGKNTLLNAEFLAWVYLAMTNSQTDD
jgi:hypothetical protein